MACATAASHCCQQHLSLSLEVAAGCPETASISSCWHAALPRQHLPRQHHSPGILCAPALGVQGLCDSLQSGWIQSEAASRWCVIAHQQVSWPLKHKPGAGVFSEILGLLAMQTATPQDPL